MSEKENKFRHIRDLNPWFLRYRCSALPTELSSQLGAISQVYLEPTETLAVGSLAQLVEQCTGIAEVIGSNPVHAWIFFRPYFHHCLSSVHNCEGHFYIRFFDCSSYMIFIYLQSFIHHFMGLFGTNLITSALPTELTSQLGTISKVSQVYLEPSWTLTVGLLAQLVERCTGIARVMRSNPVRQTAKIASIFVSSTAVHIYMILQSFYNLLAELVSLSLKIHPREVWFFSLHGDTGCYENEYRNDSV